MYQSVQFLHGDSLEFFLDVCLNAVSVFQKSSLLSAELLAATKPLLSVKPMDAGKSASSMALQILVSLT